MKSSRFRPVAHPRLLRFEWTAIPTAAVFAYEARMALTLDQVRHVAKLAELELTPAELERLATDLSAILAHFDQLQSVPSAPTAEGSIAAQTSAFVRLRADEPRPGISHEGALRASPKVLDDGFAVPAFVDD